MLVNGLTEAHETEDEPQDAVAFLNMCDALANFVYLASDVSTTDVGVLLQEDAVVLNFPCFN